MNETNTKRTCVSYRHWLKLAEVVLGLILLVLKIYEALQNLHLL